MTLWLVRHGKPLVEPGVCYGALDVDVDAKSTQQAAQALDVILPRGMQVFSSPLQRCKRLATDLQSLRSDLSCDVDARLAEMNFGRHEGCRWDSIAQAAYDDWTADFWNHRFGGIESVAELMGRVGLAWDEVLQSGQDTVWITHAGVIRAASLLARGVRRIDKAAHWPDVAPDFGQWLTLAVR